MGLRLWFYLVYLLVEALSFMVSPFMAVFSKKIKRKKRKDPNFSEEGDQQLRENDKPDHSEAYDTFSENKEASEAIGSKD